MTFYDGKIIFMQFRRWGRVKFFIFIFFSSEYKIVQRGFRNSEKMVDVFCVRAPTGLNVFVFIILKRTRTKIYFLKWNRYCAARTMDVDSIFLFTLHWHTLNLSSKKLVKIFTINFAKNRNSKKLNTKSRDQAKQYL